MSTGPMSGFTTDYYKNRCAELEHTVEALRTASRYSADKKQVDGAHYLAMRVQPWDFLHANDPEGFKAYLKGNILKYLFRQKHPSDLQKALHCMEKLVEVTSE